MNNFIFERFKADAAKPNASEATHQKVIFIWAALNTDKYPQLKWLHAIPNADSHRQVAEGVRAGVSDICLPFPKLLEIKHDSLFPFSVDDCIEIKHVAGLYIELKTEKRRNQKNGGCSDDQIAFTEYANSVGYKAVVCYGWQEAVKVIEEYLS